MCHAQTPFKTGFSKSIVRSNNREKGKADKIAGRCKMASVVFCFGHERRKTSFCIGQNGNLIRVQYWSLAMLWGFKEGAWRCRTDDHDMHRTLEYWFQNTFFLLVLKPWLNVLTLLCSMFLVQQRSYITLLCNFCLDWQQIRTLSTQSWMMFVPWTSVSI